MHNNLHIPALEELHRALTHVLQIRRGGGNHVDNAQDALLAGGVAVGVVVIVVMVVMVMRVVVPVVVIMARVFVLMLFRVAVVIMIVSMSMPTVAAFMLILLRMRLRVRRALVLKPELRYRVTHDPAQRTKLLQRIAHAVLRIGGEGKHQSHPRALDERDCGQEDEDGDDARGDGVPARPAVVLSEEGGDDDGYGAEGVGEDVQEDALHVLVVVGVAVSVVVISMIV